MVKLSPDEDPFRPMTESERRGRAKEGEEEVRLKEARQETTVEVGIGLGWAGVIAAAVVVEDGGWDCESGEEPTGLEGLRSGLDSGLGAGVG
ncbi:hypothetical protein MMYC01_207490 [Madurella mycetomatis]|uniref:Uncharacterized protein n=1 Tax=Madurella mycetomatis TaxID=100816 RepID=A0A175VV23_9PEZI|nr:hypothetical protein MMYC01_207490 [Madurella mycetomatis]